MCEQIPCSTEAASPQRARISFCPLMFRSMVLSVGMRSSEQTRIQALPLPLSVIITSQILPDVCPIYDVLTSPKFYQFWMRVVYEFRSRWFQNRIEGGRYCSTLFT